MAGHDDEVPPGIATLGRLLEICVYAPLGAGAKLIDDAPGAVARARQELSNARFIGRMVVSQSESRLRDRMTSPTPAVTDVDDAPDVDEAPAPDADDAPDVDDAPTPVAEDVEDASDVEGAGRDDDELALPDYDHLPAIDIIDQLESLTDDELAGVERYERANRRRRTVLGKIAQLRDVS